MTDQRDDAAALRDTREVLAGDDRERQGNAVYAVYVAVIAAGAYGVPAAQSFFRVLDPAWLAAHLTGPAAVGLGAAALAGLLLAFLPVRGGSPGRRDQNPSKSAASVPSMSGARGWARVDRALALGGVVGLATALAWIVAPTSASGPTGMPRGNSDSPTAVLKPEVTTTAFSVTRPP